jgi:hypothetical protein
MSKSESPIESGYLFEEPLDDTPQKEAFEYKPGQFGNLKKPVGPPPKSKEKAGKAGHWRYREPGTES